MGGGGGGGHWLCYKRLSATHCCNIKRNFYGYRNLQSLIFTALSAEVVAILQVNLKSSHWNTQWYYDELVFGQPKKHGKNTGTGTYLVTASEESVSCL